MFVEILLLFEHSLVRFLIVTLVGQDEAHLVMLLSEGLRDFLAILFEPRSKVLLPTELSFSKWNTIMEDQVLIISVREGEEVGRIVLRFPGTHDVVHHVLWNGEHVRVVHCLQHAVLGSANVLKRACLGKLFLARVGKLINSLVDSIKDAWSTILFAVQIIRCRDLLFLGLARPIVPCVGRRGPHNGDDTVFAKSSDCVHRAFILVKLFLL